MEKTYSVKEASKLLGYSMNSIYSFLKDGDIKSVRIGKGKFRIPQSEIDKFLGAGASKEKLEDKKMVEKMVAEVKEEVAPTEPGPVILPLPRPGKSLEELGGEKPLTVIKLWFEERVTIPKLFDWFISLSSIILGASMYLHTKQVDALTVGRFSIWFTPIRISLMLSGLGLIIADMIQEEFVRYRNLSNYFRVVLFVTYLGLSWILLQGSDIDGFMIYGLFAVTILIEAAFAVKSSTAYMLFIQGLLISTALIFVLFPADPSLSQISGGLLLMLDGFKWIWTMVVVSLIMITLYGFFWEKKVLKTFSAFCGILLIFLALYFANNNYWDRAFFILIAGMIGLIEPIWELFKLKFQTDRPMVFRMFGTVLMFFSLVIILIAIVQSILLQDANRNLAEKADFGRLTAENVVNSGFSALDGIAQNPLFQKAFKAGDTAGMDSFTKAIFKSNADLGIVLVLDNSGKAISSYPFSSDVVGRYYMSEIFFRSVSAENKYFSRTVEPLAGVSNTAIIIGTPITEKGLVIGAMVATVNLNAMGDRLEEIATSSLDQKVTLIDGGGRWLFVPQTGVVGERVAESDTTNLLWSRTTGAEIGYDSAGKYSLFSSGKAKDLNWTVVVSQPIFSILDVSRSGLMIVLFLLSVAVLTVSFSFVFSKKRM